MPRGAGKKCWSCGEDLAVETGECTACGEAQEKLQVDGSQNVWNCPYCGTSVQRADRDSHVCREMSEARMVRARQNLRTGKRRSPWFFHVFMGTMLSLFYYGFKLFKEGTGPLASRGSLYLLSILVFIALLQNFAGLKKKIAGLGPVSLLLYVMNLVMIVFSIMLFCGFTVIPYAMLGLWLVNTYLLRYLGRRRLMLLSAQWALLVLVVTTGVLFFADEAVGKTTELMEAVRGLNPEGD